MRRHAVLAVLMAVAVPAISVTLLGVRELRELIVSARAAGDSDADIAHKVSRVPLKERLTEGALADIRAIGLGPRTAAVLELLADVSEFLPGVEAPGTAPLTPGEGEAVLAKARDYAADYIRNLPDFICTRVIRRFATRIDIGRLRGLDHGYILIDHGSALDMLHLQDTITGEVSFDHGKESYAAQTVNGRAREQSVPGLTTWGEFGGILGSLLVARANLKTEWSRWEVVGGKPVAVFRYSVDRRHSRYTVTWCCDGSRRREIPAGYTGELFIEPASGSVLRVTRQAALPQESPLLTADTMVEYRPALIGGRSYLCPVRSVSLSLWNATVGVLVFSVNEVRFGSYHKFGATSTLVASAAQPEAGLETTAPPKPAIAAPAPAAPTAPFEAPAPISAGTDSPPPRPAVLNQPAQAAVFRAKTRLVDVSAVVVGKQGLPVTDLKKEDFEVYDEGRQQSIRLFSAPSANPPDSTDTQPAVPPPSPRVFSNRIEQGPRRNPPTIILIDEGVATWEERAFARGRIIRFLRQVQPGEPIGLYVPGDAVSIVHEFTRDSSDLVSSIEDYWYHSVGNNLTARLGGDQRPVVTEMNESCSATPSLRAIAASANHVAGITGRKSLIWISGGPPVVFGVQNCFKQETEALRAVNRANVAVYSIDFRGLQTIQPDATITAKEFTLAHEAAADPTPLRQAKVAPNALNALMQTKLEAIEQGQSLMRDVADRTGGSSFTNTNDILGAIHTAFAESHATYALGFYPESSRFDGRYHRLEVKVPSRPDVTVRYRRGYVDARDSSDPDGQLRDAVWSPLDASAIALTAEMIATAGGGYDVKLNIGLADLDLQEEGGRWQGRIHVILAQKDERGQQFDYLDDTLHLELKPDRYEAMLKSGLAYHRVFQRNPKAASLRVVVRDEAGNLGSVTIPLSPPGQQ